ncbi:MAG: hypothetical protein DRH50_06885 [Deltaproteobacteria bacterium]|nr:MAG: hypothetical protein DRH50_06885 [Deltaproteobacteria bacterium]
MAANQKRNLPAKIWLYPDFSNVHFLLYTVVSGNIVILQGSKTGWDLRWNIEVANHEKNDVRKGIQCPKSACALPHLKCNFDDLIASRIM